MPELLIYVIDRSLIATSAQAYAEGLKLHDVVEVHPDGWNWSQEEREHPRWRILAWPRTNIEDCWPLLAHGEPEFFGGPRGFKRYLPTTYSQARQRAINWAHDVAKVWMPGVWEHLIAPRTISHFYVDAPGSLLSLMVENRPAIRREPAEIIAEAEKLGENLEREGIDQGVYDRWLSRVRAAHGLRIA